jgi:ABC-type uncharacterized transport system permease subunit
MQYIRPILIFFKAQYRIQSQDKTAFLISLLTPVLYSLVFIYQIVVTFSVDAQDPFTNLPISDYFAVFFSLQMIVFLSADQSQRQLVVEVLDGRFDYHLLRPVGLSIYKYFRAPSLNGLLMTWLYFFCLLITAVYFQIHVFKLLTLILFVFVATFIYLNIKSSLRALIFYYRDALATTLLEDALNSATINKPPEVFPAIVQSVFIAILPIFIVHNNLFDIIRLQALHTILPWTLFWIAFSLFLNLFVWHHGVRRYESA